MIRARRTLPGRAAIAAALLVLAGCGGAQPAAEIENPDPLDLVTAQELFDAGMTLLRSGDYVRAEQYLLAARDRGHPEEEVVPALVSTCVRSSRISAALAHAEPYLARHPEQWQLRLLVGTLHLALGEVAEAERAFERVIADQPDEAQGHYLLAVLARDELARPEIAREHFQRYLDLAPEGEHAEEARSELTGRAPPIAARDAGPTRLPRHAAEEGEGPAEASGGEAASRPEPGAGSEGSAEEAAP